MQFDDRLATVLRHPPLGEAAARTQMRQLVDLLGSASGTETGPLINAAYARLEALGAEIPGAVQSKILREPGLRLRNPALVARLALGDPQAAAAAMATARLSDAEWERLIPRLPIVARGLLRHRRDLPPRAMDVLRRLGVSDLVLPEPPGTRTESDQAAPAGNVDGGEPAPGTSEADASGGIARLVRRIEEFQKTRRGGPASPRLPLGGAESSDGTEGRKACDIRTDAAGLVVRADAAFAPVLVGLPLLAGGDAVALDEAARARVLLRQPLANVALVLEGPAAIAGAWRLDAVPVFREDGSFSGFCGRLRRPAPAASGEAPVRPAHPEAERMRQVLHELRTPVNAIQGFAEIIQQQLFGPVPNEYRALAAGIAVDAARLLGGLEDVERLARLESGAMALPEGQSDLGAVAASLVRRLDGALRPRSARIDLEPVADAIVVPLAPDDAQLLVWRLLAVLSSGLAPGETVGARLAQEGEAAIFEAELPLSLADQSDLFTATAPAQARAVSAGMFGSGFSLRLARAEAEAAGGTLERRGEVLTLRLPLAMHGTGTTRDGTSGGMSAA